MSNKENKKIKNATTSNFNGINFKSKLEMMAYKTLVEKGLNPQYESKKFILMEGFKPTALYYTRDKKTKELVVNNKKLINITYTPDFIIEKHGYTFILELKGQVNDTFPIKRKLFRNLLESMSNTVFFELYTKKDVLTAIDVINSYGENK